MVASERDISGQDSRRNIIIVVAIIAAILIAGLFYLLMRRSEEHTSEPSHLVISYAVFCLKKKKNKQIPVLQWRKEHFRHTGRGGLGERIFTMNLLSSDRSIVLTQMGEDAPSSSPHVHTRA